MELLAGLGLDQAQEIGNALRIRDFIDGEFDAEFFLEADDQFDMSKAIPFGEIQLRMSGGQLEVFVIEHFTKDTLESDKVRIQEAVSPAAAFPTYHTDRL